MSPINFFLCQLLSTTEKQIAKVWKQWFEVCVVDWVAVVVFAF